MNKKVIVRLVGALLVLVLLVGMFGACAKPSPGPAPAPAPAPAPKPKIEKVVIGEIAAYSGPIASITERVTNGQEMALEEINAAGGIKSLGGAKLEIIHLDHEWKAELMKEHVDRLINREKVHVLIQGSPSGFGVLVGKMANAAGIADYTILVNTPAKNEQGFNNVFSTPKNSRMIAYTTYEFMNFLADKYMSKKPKTIGLLYADTEYNNQVIEGAIKRAPEFGYEVVSDVVFPCPSKDLTSFVLKLKADNPDWLFINPIGEAVAIERALDVLGWDPLRIGVEGSYVETALIEGLSSRAENILSLGNYSEEATPAAKVFADNYRKKYGDDPDSMSAQGYQIVHVIAAAIEKAGAEGNWDTLEYARLSIIEASQKLVYTDKTGPLVQPYKRIEYGPDGQVPLELTPTAGTQVQDGKFRKIYPEMAGGASMKFRDGWKKWMK